VRVSEPKYRTGEPTDTPAIKRVLGTCFNITEARAALSMDRAGLNEIRVLDAGGGELAAVTYLIPMGIFFGGRSISNLGIAAVGVPPEHRGRAYSTQMMQAVLREAHDRGFAVSTLHPATQTVYRKVGYQFFGGYYETALSIAGIDVRDRTAELRRYRPQDKESVRALHSKWVRGFDGHLDRGEYVWHGVHQLRETPTEGYLVHENGELTGYCFLLQEPHVGLQFNLRATDLVASTSRAARRLLTFFADHRSLAHQLIWNGGPTDPLLMEMSEDRYQVRLRHYVMLRILDAKRAFEARGYPRLVKAKLELELDDPLLPAHAGRWTLDVADGYGELSRGGEGKLRTDAAGLTALFSQLHPAPRLAALGWIHGDTDAIETARSIFAGPQASLTEMF
jgi:predicted acetyltransferase